MAINGKNKPDALQKQFAMLKQLGKPAAIPVADAQPDEREQKAAGFLLEGKPIREALIRAGYATTTANMGRKAITDGILKALLLQGFQYEEVGRQLIENPELAERTVMGFLYQSIRDRNSRGVNAAKLMGMHKRVNMFVADQQQNVLVIQAPTGWEKPADAPEPKAQPNPREKDLPEYE
jgi:hypothetical protein